MKFEISNQLAAWLRRDGRDDLAKLGEVDVPVERFQKVWEEAHGQHPEEDDSTIWDRALFRCLTHPEWAPTRLQVAKGNRETRERWLRYAWAFLVVLLLLLILLRSAHGQEKPVYQAQGKEAIRAEASKKEVPPVVADTDKLAFRELQVEQDRYLIELADLEAAYLRKRAELKEKVAQLAEKIQQAAYDLALKDNLDPKRYVLDLRTITWEKKEKANK